MFVVVLGPSVIADLPDVHAPLMRRCVSVVNADRGQRCWATGSRVADRWLAPAPRAAAAAPAWQRGEGLLLVPCRVGPHAGDAVPDRRGVPRRAAAGSSSRYHAARARRHMARWHRRRRARAGAARRHPGDETGTVEGDRGSSTRSEAPDDLSSHLDDVLSAMPATHRRCHSPSAAAPPPARDRSRTPGSPASSSSTCCSRRSTCRAPAPGSTSPTSSACRSTSSTTSSSPCSSAASSRCAARSGPSRGSYIFDLAGAGRDRAREALRRRASTSGPRRCRWTSTASGWSTRASGTRT